MTHPLTIIVTSCDRFDLLERTLDSFFALNKYPYEAFHIHNDSVNGVPMAIIQKYSDKNITWHSGTKRGLSASWDYLVGLVETEYLFSIEEDWLFDGNPNFIEDSINLLEFNEGITQVWIRSEKDHNHPLSKEVFHLHINKKKILFKEVKHIKDWCGFSFNPSVRVLSRWKKWFPNGIAGKDEIELSRDLYYGYSAVSLVNSSIRHIGGGRHSKGFKI